MWERKGNGLSLARSCRLVNLERMSLRVCVLECVSGVCRRSRIVLTTCVNGTSCHGNGLVAPTTPLLSSLAGSAHLTRGVRVCVCACVRWKCLLFEPCCSFQECGLTPPHTQVHALHLPPPPPITCVLGRSAHLAFFRKFKTKWWEEFQ